MCIRLFTFAAALAAFCFTTHAANAQAPAALAGQVSSVKEGAMEGVVISAKKAGGTVTVSVVSDAKGHYSFPASKLEPGQYALTIRALGYELDGPKAAEVAAGNAATADITLVPTKKLPLQLSNAEWLASMPGTDNQKKATLGCISCHDLDRIVGSMHTADEFMQIFERMSGYYPGSTPEFPQRLNGDARRQVGQGPGARALAEFFASVNLSQDETWTYELKGFPRPTGRATRVVITEYDLPRKKIQPHDVLLDNEGTVWFSHFGEMFLGKMDPKTGKVDQYPVPVIKAGFPIGTLDLETTKSGDIWLSLMYQGGVARFDKKTGTFQTWSVPQEWQTDATQQAFVSPNSSHVDGKVWVKNSDRAQILRLDPNTGAWENFGSFNNPNTGNRIQSYGIPVDPQNNLYLLDFAANGVGKLDKNGKLVGYYPGKIANSRPRRGRIDDRGRLWYAEYGGNAIGMLDPATNSVKEWTLPTSWAQPYDAVLDKNGEAWTGSMLSDRVSRLDPKTGEFVEYLLPRNTNIRRVFVDNTTTPVTYWTGNNHGASIVQVEPLD
ncbi:MAG TPA: carboxypeptidase regulatory-like domain-containing protein [Xanthobacteraceae bacterium]|nr:carboxypeptidase regulatory-like domain-containing protein [Xanthobacteraceae bacterium]